MFTSKLKTTAEVLSVFTKTIQDLKTVMQQHDAESVKQRQAAQEAIAKAEASEAEAKAASAAVTKLEGFLAP